MGFDLQNKIIEILKPGLVILITIRFTRSYGPSQTSHKEGKYLVVIIL